MITKDTFLCPVCKNERYQRVVFIAGEFSYQCPECLSLHVFYENLFPRFQDNFQFSKWSRYVGTFNGSEFVVTANVEIAKKYKPICENFLKAKDSSFEIKRTILSDKADIGKYFIASAYHDHFQEALRGYVRMQEHIQEAGNDTRNILILPLNEPSFDFISNNPEKLIGVDELWQFPLKKEYRWPYCEKSQDVLSCSYAVTQLLDTLLGLGEVVTKRSGPLPGGKVALRNLLECSNNPKIENNLGKELDKKHIGILIHSDDTSRAGLKNPEQLKVLIDWARKIKEDPILIATTKSEQAIANTCSDCSSVFLPTIQQQVVFYKNFCQAVIGSNCSGCNIPALYEIPIFAFVKKRSFPDDFYCFARMASTYSKEIVPWHGDLEKAENIIEVKVDCSKQTDPEQHLDQLNSWYYKYVMPISYRREGRGWKELCDGFNDPCPICNRINFTRKIKSVRTDLCCEYVCEHCSCEHVSYRGLTSLSIRDTFFKNRKDVIPSKWYRSYCDSLNENYSSQKEDTTIIDISYIPSRPSVVFYCIKPSIADLYYMLPTLYHMRCGYRQECNIIAFVPKAYLDLIPKEFVDRVILLNKDPRDIHCGKDFCSASIDEFFKQYQGMVSSNLPGTLPYSPDLYKYVGSLLVGEKVSKVIDVVFFCRLSSSRIWPNQTIYENLKELLKVKNYNYRFLVFPENEGVPLPNWFEGAIVNPTIREQIDLLKQSFVCITPHGAGEVIPAITGTPVLELETIPNWWKQKDPQPIRFGISLDRYKKIEARLLTEISIELIFLELEKLRKLKDV